MARKKQPITKMICPKCSSSTKIISSNSNEVFSFRTRECNKCFFEFITVESYLYNKIKDLRNLPEKNKQVLENLLELFLTNKNDKSNFYVKNLFN